MHRTRSLLSSQHTASSAAMSAVKGLQIPLRGSLEVLASSAQACVSFALSREKRERFLDLANRGTINPVVLGIPLSLALYHDLSSPLFEKYGFDVDEFGAGARVALENFHDVQFRLQEELEKGIAARRDDGGGGDATDAASSSTETEGTETENDSCGSSSSAVGEGPLGRTMLTDLTNVLGSGGEEWKTRAASDPESLPGLLSRMVTPEYFQEIAVVMNAQSVMVRNQEKLLDLKNWKGEVTSLNLLSARAATIPPPPATEEELSRMTEEEIQRNDDIINNVYVDLPVAAQLEVLYELKTTVTMEPHGDNSGTSGRSGAGDSTSAETVTQSAPVVGVFEGWLHGSPTGSLQWKLALNRPFYGV